MVKIGKIILGIIVVFSLDSCSNKIEENDWIRKNLKGKVQSYTEISYTAEERFGNIKKGKRKSLVSGGIVEIQSKYDENGNQIELVYYKSDGSLYTKDTYRYNKNGNKIEKKKYNVDGILIKYTYEYDERGNQIEWNFYRPDGSLDLKYTYKYDERGNQIE